MDFEPTLKQVSGDLSGIISQLIQWNQLNDKIASGTAKIKSNVRNQGGIGQGITNMMDGSLSSFSGGSSGRGGGGGGTGGGMTSNMNATMGKFSGAVQMVQGVGEVAQGINQMMPNVGGVLNRAAGYYNAMSASGSIMNRGAVESMTRNSLGKGNLSSESAAVNSAAILMGAGVTAGSKNYKQILKTAGGLTQLTGMSNEAGVSALSGFISGAGSSNLMKNFGIQTSTMDGKSKSPEQIVHEIKARLTAGRGKYTTADVNDSYAKGALGVTLRNSGLTPDQQQIVLKSLLADATDSKTGPLNLDSQKSLKNATDKQGGNPLASSMTVAGAKDQAAQAAEGNYIAGANTAASNLSTLNDVAGELAKTFGGLKAYLDTMQGDPVTTGFLQGLKGLGDIGIGAAKLFSRGGVVSGPGTGTSDSINAKLSAGEVVLPVSTVNKHSEVVKALLADMPASSGPTTSPSLTSNSNKRTVSAHLRSAASRVAAIKTATGVGRMSMPSRTGSGGSGPATQGSGGAATTAAGGAPAQGVGGNGRISLIPPVNGPLGDEFGNNAPYRKGNLHHGQDWSVSEGTVVVACADGIVVDTDWSGQLGKTVHISHGNGYFTRYCHLSNNSMVSKGAQVKQGQQIAISGNTGSATTGAHLHLELKQGSQYLNPMNFMSGAMASGSTTGANGADTSGSSSQLSPSVGSAQSTVTPRPGSTQDLPMAQSSSSALSVSGSGISGNGDALSAAINGGYQGGGNTGGGGEGTDPSSTTVKSGHDLAGQLKGNNRGSSGGNNVTIHLSIAKASEMEARIFAKKVKEFLEEDNRMATMGRS